MQVFALGRTEGLFLPFLALGLGHKLHEIVIGELRGLLPKAGPGGFQRFVFPAKLRQQLAVNFIEIVARPASEPAIPVKSAPTFDPGQGLIRFLSS